VVEQTEVKQPHILSVSYDEALQRTRELILASNGYRVTSAWGLDAALRACTAGKFDLFILGHSIPPADKRRLIKTFRRHCDAPVIALQRGNEPDVAGADYRSDTDPTALVALVGRILHSRRN
jgi:DNA-binding response OmpR family regulator